MLLARRRLDLNLTRGRLVLDSLRANLKAAERTRRRRAREQPLIHAECVEAVLARQNAQPIAVGVRVEAHAALRVVRVAIVG